MPVRLASAPTSWGIDFADTPANPPWQRVLDEIADSGAGALELGPVGYLPEDAATVRRELETRGLRAVGSFVFDDLHTPAERARVLQKTERTCRMIADAGGSVLVIIDQPGDERAPTAGRSADAARLDADGRDRLAETLRQMAGVAVRHGLRPAVHPHAGGFIEFDDEIDWVVEATELDLCLDTGHLFYAGIDPVDAIERYRDRIAHIHLKDVSLDARQTVVDRRMGFWEAVALPIFCPMGKGGVDIAAVLAALDRIGYDGYAVLEQDRVPGVGDPLDDVRTSLATVRAAGTTF
ncbi:TIM barrel protein [Microbacterium sp. 179-I 3D3 NHS]|uniref:TIM barrel protein n=1 Tax=unclassified Microbacterium TaxID=2609290 RepID=UPI0039A200B4